MSIDQMSSPKPRGGMRMLYASDIGSDVRSVLPDHPLSYDASLSDKSSPIPTAEELRHYIDTLVDSGVDMFAQCVFAKQGVGWFWPEHPDHAHDPEIVDRIDPTHGPPIEVAIDQCHKRGIQFIAKFRMADRHSGGQRGLIAHREDLWNKDFGDAAMDYTHDEVRNWVVALMEEILRRFDVDGFELNYIRWMHVFPRAIARENHPIMTKFIRRVRQKLDALFEEKGRRLLLGVRVPQTLEECHALGYNVPTWIKEGLIDYVSPCDFFYPDFNAKYEEFAALTDSSNCLLFPTVHPGLCGEDDIALMRPENYRAVVQNMYAAGADGISQFNYQYHWGRRRRSRYAGPCSGYPTALAWLRQMRDPEKYALLPRHYLFYPLWPEVAPSGFAKHDRIVLNREIGSSGEYRFRITENLSVPGVLSELIVTATSSDLGDRLEFSINGTTVPAEKVKIRWNEAGRSPEFGRPLSPCLTFMFRLSTPPATFGDNILSAKVIALDEQGQGNIVIDELEVTVLPPAEEADQS